MNADRADPPRSRFDRWLGRRATGSLSPGSQAIVLVALLALVVLTGWIDALAGRQVSLFILYMLPMSLAAIVLGTWAGVVIAIAGLAVWLYPDSNYHGHLEWNVPIRVAAIIAVILVVRSLRMSLRESARERESTQRFLANAAHQLRTPISGVMVTAEALETETDPTARARLVHHLMASTERVGHLLHSLLQFASVSAGADRRVEPFDAVEVCDREIDHVEIRYPEIAFRQHGPPSAMASGDPHHVGEAIANLLDNAGRHAAGSVELTILEQVGRAEIVVRDDGPGVPAGQEEAIFERFLTIGPHGGAGLGLPIARELMEREGGGVEFRDGAFHLWLPTQHRWRRYARTPRPDLSDLERTAAS